MLLIFWKDNKKHLCRTLFFNKVNLLKKDTPEQVFSSEFCDISLKNTFFVEHFRWLFLNRPFIGVLRTLPNIYDGVFFNKKYNFREE